MGAVLRRLLDIPAPRRTRASKRPDPPHHQRARAASGHAAAAPPSATSNSRRPMVTVIRALPCEVRKGNDTTPRACCPLTARLAPRGRPPKNGAIDHPQPGADKVDSAEGMATLEAMSSHHNFRPGQRNKLV